MPIFNAESTKAELDKLPKGQGQVGVVATKDDVGVEGTVSTNLGAHTELEAEGSWWRNAGWKVAAFLKFSK